MISVSNYVWHQSFLHPALVPSAPEDPSTGLFLTQFRASILGFLIHPCSLCAGVQQRILRLSDGHLRGNERERSAAHLAEDYPFKRKGWQWRWRREGVKRMCLRDRYRGGGWRERLRGQSGRWRGKMNHIEIKCVWVRVNKKSMERNIAMEGNV